MVGVVGGQCRDGCVVGIGIVVVLVRLEKNFDFGLVAVGLVDDFALVAVGGDFDHYSVVGG